MLPIPLRIWRLAIRSSKWFFGRACESITEKHEHHSSSFFRVNKNRDHIREANTSLIKKIIIQQGRKFIYLNKII